MSPVSISASRVQREATRICKRAARLVEKREYNSALDKITAARKLHGIDAQTSSNLCEIHSLALIRLGLYQEAADCATEGLRLVGLSPDSRSSLLYRQAYANNHLHNLPTARSAALEALKFAPSPGLRFSLLSSLVTNSSISGDYEEILSYARQALTIPLGKPKERCKILKLKGEAHRKLDQPEGAIEAYSQALAIAKPPRVKIDILEALADTAHSSGAYQSAETWFSEALALATDEVRSGPLRVKRAHNLVRAGEKVEAELRIREALSTPTLTVDQRACLFQLSAKVAHSRGELNLAIARTEQGLSIRGIEDWEKGRLLERKGKIELSKRDFSAAYESLQKAIALNELSSRQRGRLRSLLSRIPKEFCEEEAL